MRARVDDASGTPGVQSSGALVLEITPEPEHVRTARLFAAAAARHFAVDEERIDDLKVAISEAATNSIRAHREAGTTEPVVVSAARVADGIRFSVVDAGKGFEPAAVPSDASVTPPAGLFEGSLGLALIRTLFPKVHIAPNAGRGMSVSFVVERPNAAPA